METRSGRKGDPEPPPVDKARPKPSKPATRSAAPVADLDFDLNEAFPQMKMFHPGNKLPTIASVVGDDQAIQKPKQGTERETDDWESSLKRSSQNSRS